jgi:hypothetical protein
MTGVTIDLVEADLLRVELGRIKRQRTVHEGEPEKALPIRTRGHDNALHKRN